MKIIFGSPMNHKEYSFPIYQVNLLIDSFKLLFCANHIKKPLKEDGSIDWAKVDRIKILDVTNN